MLLTPNGRFELNKKVRPLSVSLAAFPLLMMCIFERYALVLPHTMRINGSRRGVFGLVCASAYLHPHDD